MKRRVKTGIVFLLMAVFCACEKKTTLPLSATPEPSVTLGVNSEQGNRDTNNTNTPEKEPTPEPTRKPTQEPAQKITDIPKVSQKLPEEKLEEMRNAEKGDIITFGTYEQDADTENGAEKIAWIVLEKEDDRMLLLSEYILDAKPYHNKYNKAVLWHKSSLRNWLNNEFYQTAFDAAEQGYIVKTKFETEDNPIYGTNGGGAWQDKIFLLSLSEVKKYFPFEGFEETEDIWLLAGSSASGTRQAYENELLMLDENGEIHEKRKQTAYSAEANGEWWLRSPGENETMAAFVNHSGRVCVAGCPAAMPYRGVRPALWLDLSEKED